MKKQILFFICLLIFSTLGFSQTLNELNEKLEKTTDPNELPKIHRDIGTHYYYKGDFANALKSFFLFLETAEYVNNQYNIAAAYQAIGSVYMETEKFDEALNYLEKAKQMLFELNDIENLGHIKISLGNVYYLQYQYSISNVYYKEALHHFQAINDSVGLNNAYKNLGALHFEMGNRKDTLMAVEYLKKSMDYISPNDTLTLFRGYVTLAELYTYGNFLTEAKNWLDRCEMMMASITSLDILDDYYYCLYEYNRKKGNFEDALSNYKLYTTYKDSILNNDNNKLINELNIQYETEQKEQQIELLSAQKQKQQLTILVIILSAVLLSIISLLLFLRFKKKQKRKSKQELQNQKEAERIRIARDMHDEIGAGLTRIVVRSEQIKSQLDVGEELKNGIVESLEKVTEESRALSHNIGEIIWALNPQNDTLDSLFAYIRNYAYEYLEEVDIACEIEFPENIPAISVTPELRRNVFLIVKESLNNIVKHSGASQVNITLRLTDNQFSLEIRDNGTGMESEAATGNGLGNMKRRAEILGGSFDVKNNGGLYISIDGIPFKNPTKV